MTNGQAGGSGQRAAGGARPSIELRIEELVLHGFSPGDRFRISAAVERELGRLLAERGVPGRLTDGRYLECLDGGTFDIAPAANAETIGAQTAHTIYGRFAR